MQRKATQAHQVSRGLCSLSEKYLIVYHLLLSTSGEGAAGCVWYLSCHSVMCVVLAEKIKFPDPFSFPRLR